LSYLQNSAAFLQCGNFDQWDFCRFGKTYPYLSHIISQGRIFCKSILQKSGDNVDGFFVDLGVFAPSPADARGLFHVVVVRMFSLPATVFAHNLNDFFLGRAYSPPRLCRAVRRAVKVLDATSWHAPRSGARSAPKGLMPFGIPERANVAALSLRSYLREGEHIQTLRPHFDKKMRARKCHAPSDSKNFCYLLRARFSINFKQKRKAKILAKRLPVQTTRRGYPAADALRQSRGGPQGESLGAFLPPLLGAHQEGASKTTRSARDEGAQYDRM
jgi:hypothetical protein